MALLQFNFPFKIGSAAASTLLLGSSRDGVLVRKGRSMPRRLQVKRVTTSARGAGWLQSRESSKIGRVVARSYNVNEKLRGQASTDRSTEVVRYKGTALLMKKLKMDGVADDTVSEDVLLLLREKKVVMTVQLMSNEIDPAAAAAAAGEALLSSEVSIEGLVNIFEPSTAENQLSSFDLEFAVPKTFGAPGAILVRSNSPIELLLLSFTLELPDKSCKALHYITNSWVYSTQNSEPRIFFRNKVRTWAAAAFQESLGPTHVLIQDLCCHMRGS